MHHCYLCMINIEKKLLPVSTLMGLCPFDKIWLAQDGFCANILYIALFIDGCIGVPGPFVSVCVWKGGGGGLGKICSCSVSVCADPDHRYENVYKLVMSF